MSGLGQEIAVAIVTGLLQGCVYALVALGIVLVFRASGVFNFAQAEFGTTGLFAAYAALTLWGWSYTWAIAFGLGVAVAMGLLTERLVVHPLRNASRVTVLVGTAGVALAAIGIQFWQFNDTLIMTMPRIVDSFFLVPVIGAPVTVQQLITLGVLVVASVTLALFFRSPAGLTIQAAQQEPTAAELVGISVRRVSMLTWAMAALLGGLAGILSGPNLTFTAGFLSFGAGRALLPGFMAAVLAGMRSMPGAVAGGLTVGVVEQMGTLSMMIEIPGARAMLLFGFLLVVLMVRPQGIFVPRTAAAA
ncbi:High-affinity branched-chain amino acid transport system permease protein LivH [Nocardioides dokdonensis FR1436]|uniref:High-affinity branched-chain amino acid transport system permease protein LivH n=1 Tax=Nocardioides dokdonensis FR1436 TaxID=1300347 RepID=A0A1A9GRM6_9ACTN|nr:branched-chain amino acid ABC transporter permease [Nocardioides dokdonensis]ANH40310.1 High-affinity branched-chain amino acid transport system permease protein LivH [Nocardioides dokdonensis FR1436]